MTIGNLMISGSLTQSDINDIFVDPFIQQSSSYYFGANRHLNVFNSSPTEGYKLQVSFNQKSYTHLIDYLEF